VPYDVIAACRVPTTSTRDIPPLLQYDVIVGARNYRLPSCRLEAGCMHCCVTQQWVGMSQYCEVCGVCVTGSGFDVWIYSYTLTITINDNSSQSVTAYDSLHFLLDCKCLLFHCDEWRTMNSCSHHELPQTTSVWQITPTNELRSLYSFQAAWI
jgi:hypothetical protein